MKFGIMSDSHEHMKNIAKAVSIFNSEKVDLIFHAGDIISPIAYSEFKKSKSRIIFVYGNNDGEKLFLKEKLSQSEFLINRPPFVVDKANKKILLMHEPDELDALSESKRYDLIIYGHTHIIDIRYGKPMIINPGETCGYITGRATVGVLDAQQMEYRIIDL